MTRKTTRARNAAVRAAMAQHGVSPPKRRPKYNNVRCPCDQGGVLHRHDSKKERARCWELHRLLDQGVLVDLARQVRFPIHVNNILVTTYVADFLYWERDSPDGWPVVEDVKGKRTREYLLKRKLMWAAKGIRIRET